MSRASEYQHATVKGLRWQEGDWTLELELLVPVGVGIFRPTAEPLRGDVAILGYLDHVRRDQRLAACTRRLLATTPEVDARHFEIHDDDWLALPDRAVRPVTEARAEAAAASVQRAVEALRQHAETQQQDQQLRERQAHELQDRKQLSQIFSSISQLANRVAKLERQGSMVRSEGPDQAALQPFKVQEAYPAPATSATAEPSATPGPPPIARLPACEDLAEIMTLLLGDGLTLGAVASGLALGAGPHYVVDFLADDDSVVGALLADRAATISLGTALLLVPKTGRDEMMHEGGPTNVVLDALTEIANNLSPAINKYKENMHVRSGTARVFEAEKDGWVEAPAAKVELVEDGLQGRLLLLAAGPAT